MRRPQLSYSKPYTDAVRQLLGVPFNSVPEGWPTNPRDYTAAQTLATRDVGRAIAGDPDAVNRVIDRVEGRPMSAPEDRATRNAEAEADALQGLALLAKLQMVITGKTVDVEVITE